jgi:hypothetical protein
VKSRAIQRLLLATLIGFYSATASAQYANDASAAQNIETAVQDTYLMEGPEKAESQLQDVITSCGADCSPQVMAKAWMYIGVIRGSAKEDQAGAAEAFETAKSLDPAVSLDEDLCTDATKETFYGAAAPAPEPAPAPAPAAPASDIPGDILCTPGTREILTNMPIPLSCRTDADAVSMMVKFKAPGAEKWSKITMTQAGEFFQAEIPCTETAVAGELKFYVGAKNAAKDWVDQYGSKKKFASFNLSETASEAALAFPGGEPVVRCAAASDCPPDFPGCGGAAQCGDLGWGDACSASSECQCGMACDDGTCQEAKACSSDSDCDSGLCENSVCSSAEAPKEESGPFKRHWVSFDAGIDLGYLAGVGLCTTSTTDSYGTECYAEDGGRYVSDGANGNPNDTPDDLESGGFAVGQLRLKLGYDYALTEHMLVGAKLGIAFLNNRPQKFMPLHAEARFTYVFSSLSKKGFRPALGLAAGFAESDAKAGGELTNTSVGPVKVYKVGGTGFAAPFGSLGWAFEDNMVLRADLNFMLLFPNGGLLTVAHPSLGFSYGF